MQYTFGNHIQESRNLKKLVASASFFKLFLDPYQMLTTLVSQYTILHYVTNIVYLRVTIAVHRNLTFPEQSWLLRKQKKSQCFKNDQNLLVR